METVTSRFEQGTDVLNNNFTKLFSYIDNAEANQKRSLTLFEQTYENITSANERQTASIEQFSSTVSTLQTFSENCSMDAVRSEEHTSELQSRGHLVCRLLLEKKKKIHRNNHV